MARSLDEVLAQMRAYRVDPPDDSILRKAFDTYVRWRPGDQKGAKKSAWARLYTWRSPKTGKEYITGAFGCRGDVWNVESSSSDWSPAERAAEMEARKAAAKAAETERLKDAQAAATKAERLWAKGLPADETRQHPYLERKRVSAFGLRVAFGKMLMVPARDMDGRLQLLQYISPEGDKRFGTGSIKESRFHLIGEVQAALPVAFAEGYATAATVHMATGWPVVTCFDAGNLEPVMRAWRALYPEQRFVIAADDDRHLLQRLSERLLKLGITVEPAELKKLGERVWDIPDGPTVELKAGWKADPNGGPMRIEGSITVDGQLQMLKLENAGQAKAWAAAKKHKADVLTPRFGAPDHPGTDWNDLHCDAGLEAVREALLKQFEAPPAPKKSRERSAAGAGQEGGDGDDDGDRPEGGLPFKDRFVLIYGTTTVWDVQQRDIIKVEALKLAFGKTADYWLTSNKRMMVPRDNVVFDPTGAAKLPTHVNLFDRLPLEPDREARCDVILRHFYNLCGENEGLFDWLMCWLAYPLQHPGAKMRTSVILHGRTEGTGKSLAMDIMRDIYGRYSRSITQRQIESEFNGWQSAMLFCIAEEVVSRQDRAHLQGLLQNMITNPVVQINEKNMPVREEANHTNFVFLSNNQVPLLLNDTDRRFTVIRVEQEHPEAYFQEIGRQRSEGGSAAFYRYLLDYDLRDFNEHTRPFETKERTHLITLGMQPDRRFFEFWRTGLADVPFCTCTARDLYTAYRAWARGAGERFIANSTQFGRTVTDCLQKVEAPPKGYRRWHGYSAAQIEKGIGGDDMTSDQNGLVYYVPRALERMELVPRWAENREPDDPPPDEGAASYVNRRIQAFQRALHELIASARRAL